jgi:hypothetical protein
MTAEPEPGKIVLDSVKYQLASEKGQPIWETASGRPVRKKFTFGGSMGETECHHEGDCDGLYFAEGFDTSDGTLRLHPQITTVGARYTGTFDDAGGATLTDSAGAFPTAAHGLDDYTVTITDGTGKGKAARVTSNTGTALSISPSITTDTDSTYDVSVLGTFLYRPMSFFEDFDANGYLAKYVIFEDHTTTPDIIIVKIYNDTPCDREISAAAADTTHAPILGRVEVFEGATYVPSGDSTGSNVMRKLAAVGNNLTPADDTWENADASTWASACAGIMDGSVAKFIRATGNTVALTSTEPKTLASYESVTEVGDSTDNIVWITETSDGLVAIHTVLNLWLFDPDKNAYSVLPVNRHKAMKYQTSHDDFDGHMGTALSAGVVHPARTALWFYENRQVKKISIDHIPGYRPVPNISNIPFGLRHYACTAFGDWMYSIYKPTGATNSANVHIKCGQYDPNRRNVKWRPFLTFAKDIIGLKIDPDMKLNFIYDPQPFGVAPGIPSADWKHVALAADGSPRTALGSKRGTASTTYLYYFPEWDGDMPEENIQWRKMMFEAENLPASDYVSIQTQACRNGGAAASVGDPVTTAGTGVYTSEWTVGTSDTAYRLRPVIELTTHASYAPASSDPRVLWLILVGRSPDTLRTVVLEGESKNMREVRKTLRKLKNAGVKTVFEPGTNESFSGQVIAVNDITHEGKPACEVMLNRWEVEA